MKPLYLDTDEFTRLGASRSGLQPLGGLSRLGSLLSDSDGELSWRVGVKASAVAMAVLSERFTSGWRARYGLSVRAVFARETMR